MLFDLLSSSHLDHLSSSEAKASRVMMLKFTVKLPVNSQAAKSLDVQTLWWYIRTVRWTGIRSSAHVQILFCSRSRGKSGRGQVDGTPRTSRVRLFDIPVCYPVTVEDISLCSSPCTWGGLRKKTEKGGKQRLRANG